MTENIMNQIQTEDLKIEAGIYTRPNGRWGFVEFLSVVDQIAYDEGADIDDGLTDDEK